MKTYDYKGKKNLYGKRAREARLRQRLSQYALAAKLQIEGIFMEQDSISRIEMGTCPVMSCEVRVITGILNTSMQWLLGEE